MKSSERIVIYSALAVLGAFNLVLAMGNSGRQAFAEAAAWLAELGPAESLKLVDGEKELTVRNKAGRLTWGEGDFKQSYSVGFVHISKVLNQLMDSEQFSEERKRLGEDMEKTDAEYKEKLDAMREKMQGLDRESPEFKQAYEEGNKLYQEYTRWTQEAMAQRNTMDVEQLEKSYRELVSAVEVVADKLGVDIVYRFIPTETEFKAEDAGQALEEVRLRTAIKYPTGLDITSEVLEELSLEEEPEE